MFSSIKVELCSSGLYGLIVNNILCFSTSKYSSIHIYHNMYLIKKSIQTFSEELRTLTVDTLLHSGLPVTLTSLTEDSSCTQDAQKILKRLISHKYIIPFLFWLQVLHVA